MVVGPNASASAARGSVPVRRLQPHEARHRAQQAHHRRVGVVERLDQHHLVARVQHRHQAGGDRLGGAGGHHHLARPIDLQPIEAAVGGGHRLAQLRHAGHRRILVAAVLQRVGRRLHDVGRAFGVGEALAEVDRVVLDRERRHHREDRGADAGQQGVGGLHWDTAPPVGRAASMGPAVPRCNVSRRAQIGPATRRAAVPHARITGRIAGRRDSASREAAYASRDRCLRGTSMRHPDRIAAWHAACNPLALPFRPGVTRAARQGGPASRVVDAHEEDRGHHQAVQTG